MTMKPHTWLAAALLLAHAVAAAADRPVLRALIAGVGTYQYANGAGFRQLDGPPNDVDAMRVVLTERFGLVPANTTVLLDQQATRKALLASLKKVLVDDPQAGDIALFYFAGHGSRIYDNSTDETSRFDSTILPVDARSPDGKVSDILDDELSAIVAASLAKGVKPVVILDTCHSGTGIRFLAQARYVPALVRKGPIAKLDVSVGIQSDLNVGNGTLLAAAQDNEEAVEMERDGIVQGEFTRALVGVLKRAEPTVTYLEILTRVRVGLAGLGVKHRPQGEGDLQQKFLGTGPLSRPPVMAQPLDAERAMIQVGAASGVTVGSEYEFFTTVASVAAAQPVARGTITSVAANTAEVKLANPATLPATLFAIERSHTYGDLKLRVALTGGSPVQQEKVRSAIAKLAFVDIVATNSATHWIELDGNNVQLLRADGSKIGRPRSIGSDVDEPLAILLGRLAHYQALLRLTNPLNPQSAVTGNILLADVSPENLRNPEMRDGEARVKTRQTFKVSLFNSGAKPKHVYLVNLASDLCVKLLSPPPFGVDQALAGLVRSKLLRAAPVPGREYFMVLASDEPVALEALQQPCIDEDGLRKGLTKTFSDPLAQLLYDAGSTRRRGAHSLPLGGWSTSFFSLVLE